MARQPYSPFFWNDYVADLRRHPNEIAGAWLFILKELHFSDTRGSLALTLDQWGRVLGENTLSKTINLLEYIMDEKIGSVTFGPEIEGNDMTGHCLVTVKCRRMVREDKEREGNKLRQRKHRGKRDSNGSVTPKVTPTTNTITTTKTTTTSPHPSTEDPTHPSPPHPSPPTTPRRSEKKKMGEKTQAGQKTHVGQKTQIIWSHPLMERYVGKMEDGLGDDSSDITETLTALLTLKNGRSPRSKNVQVKILEALDRYDTGQVVGTATVALKKGVFDGGDVKWPFEAYFLGMVKKDAGSWQKIAAAEERKEEQRKAIARENENFVPRTDYKHDTTFDNVKNPFGKILEDLKKGKLPPGVVEKE